MRAASPIVHFIRFLKTNTTGNTWSFNYPTAGLTYQWTFGEGSAASTQQSPTYTYTSNGTKSVKLRVTGAGGCRDSTTQTIAITTSIKDIPALASFLLDPTR